MSQVKDTHSSNRTDANLSAVKRHKISATVRKRFPSVEHMKRSARWHIPNFAWEYLIGGIGSEANVHRNIDDLQQVLFMPRYIRDAQNVNIQTTLFGKTFDAPFGAAPVGLAGLQVPGCEVHIAGAARSENVLQVLSTHATTALEKIRSSAGSNGWFQLYPLNDPEMESDLIRRAAKAGYEVLVVTVDIPVSTRRDRDIRNGLSVPPEFGIRNAVQMMMRPTWLMRLARYGIPHFENLEPYAPKGLSLTEFGEFLDRVLAGHITQERFKRIRDQWQGRIVVKGILSPEEAQHYIALGADGIVVSNHGGRQLDAAPSSVSMLPLVREKLGKDAVILVDGGVRTGLDIARMIALGADYVLMGRPFMYSIGAIGNAGPQHLIEVLKAELTGTLGQLGCRSLEELSGFLHKPSPIGSPADCILS